MSHVVKIDIADISLPYKTKRETTFKCNYAGKILTQKMPKGSPCTLHLELNSTITLPRYATLQRTDSQLKEEIIGAITAVIQNMDSSQLTFNAIVSQIKANLASMAQVGENYVIFSTLSIKKWLENGYFGNALLSTRKKEIIPSTVNPLAL